MRGADEDDFEAAGMGAETRSRSRRPLRGSLRRSPRRAGPETPTPAEPADEFEAMRRRVHEEARAAAEEMRRDPEGDGDSD